MQQIKRQLRFVRLLHKGGAVEQCGQLMRVVVGQEKASLEEHVVKALKSQGVLCIQNGALATTTEAPHWMRRQKLWLADPNQTAPIVSNAKRSGKQLPIIGNGQLNRLCKSGGKQGGLLTQDHILTASRLERLIERAMLTPQITRDYQQLSQTLGQSRGSGQADISDMAADARKELSQLYDQLPPDCINALVDLCGFGKGLQDVEASRNWPRRSAKLVAKIGLDQLGAIWGIGELATPNHLRRNGSR
ncbi:DUF6456 domain-containing protein [Maritalea sp. S77]|uniref:DUF6456 domain-containing protein n=1 Tax=Maritalea sp. S77 TaxID=3415125 RepID=UPI003C7DBA4A